MSSRSHVWSLSLLIAWGTLGCKEDAPAEEEEPTIEVGALSLAVSRRADGEPPDGALTIAIAPEGVVAGGRSALSLQDGRMADAEWNGERMPQLTAVIDAVGSRGAAVIRAHASVPYLTVSRVIATLNQHGVRSVFFEVRPGATAEVGYLPVDVAGTRLASYEPVTFQGPAQRQWQEFVDVWSEVESGCQGEGMAECERKRSSIAEGGLVEIELFTRQDAMRLLFRRHGVEGESVEEPPPFMPTQNTRTRPAVEEPVAPPPPPPSRSATFMWRRRAVSADPSPISLAMRPICGARPCAIRVSADNLTPIAQQLQLIGAAFPDGSPVPIVLWEYPER